MCEKLNINVEDVSIGMGLDKRIGSRFLRAGPAYGGSCFPKDTRAILNTANEIKSNHNDPLSMFQLRRHQHFNESGYKFVAETIIKKINQIENKN